MWKNSKITNGLLVLVVFVLWTVAVYMVDVQPIGPQGSTVGFAGLNDLVHRLTGVNWSLYTITDWLGLVPFAVAMGFAILGLVQWICRKKWWKVDFDLLVLGGFYVVLLAAYWLFENVVINYRPVLVEGVLEVSYPSSTTILATCVMPTAAIQLDRRVRNVRLKRALVLLCVVFTAFMVVGRLVSGVHWITDIIGGILLSMGLVELYVGVCDIKR